MSALKLQDIVDATGGQVLGAATAEFTGVSIDSRAVGMGNLFVALRGANFDGHDFVQAALATASGALVSTAPVLLPPGKTLVQVPDTLKALQELATWRCRSAAIPIIGVTGTNGKTTTKEMLVTIFERSRRVVKTRGNLNNHIGLPLSIVNMNGDEALMVLEMGSNREGDIRFLCEIAKPDFAAVTNVGPAHLEGFGDLETVRRTDFEILGYAGVAAINADDSFLVEGIPAEYHGSVIRYGITQQADVSAADVAPAGKGTSFTLRLRSGETVQVVLRIAGAFNVLNALAAAAIAEANGVAAAQIREGLEAFGGVPMRLEIRNQFGAVVIRDVYNANPSSVKEAIRELVRYRKTRAIAVLGDMLELGHYAAEAHRDVVRFAKDSGVDLLIAVGPEMASAAVEFAGERRIAENSDAARRVLIEVVQPGDAVLVKGSRGMRMENTLDDPAEGSGHAL